MRVGRNLYILRPAHVDGDVFALTNFDQGFVADCEVSWDGSKIIFARRLNDEERNYGEVPYQKAKLKAKHERQLGGPTDPWWRTYDNLTMYRYRWSAHSKPWAYDTLRSCRPARENRS